MSSYERKLQTSRDWKARNRARVREYRAEYFKKNREQEYENRRRWGKENPEKNKEYQKQDQIRHGKQRRAKRRDKTNAYARQRRRTDINYLITCRLRGTLWQALSKVKATKTATFRELVGCSVQQLRAHLESLFQPGMSWEKRDQIHIDHVRPCASFDLTDPAQQRLCFHYTNLQPLWASDNRKKSAKYNEDSIDV